MELLVKGAYARDYRSLKVAQQDWDNNLDFQIISTPVSGESMTVSSGRYVNKADAIKYGVSEIWLRYDGMTKKGQLKINRTK